MSLMVGHAGRWEHVGVAVEVSLDYKPLVGTDPTPVFLPRTFSTSITLDKISLPAVAILSGIPLVDLSIDYEPHLVRGTQ